jgi:hypothetical protein
MRLTSKRLMAILPSCLALGFAACGGGDDGSNESDDDGDEKQDSGTASPWQVVHEDLPGALLSVWGTAADDIWTVGSDAGEGPTVLHYDGAEWEPLDTGTAGDLWWVFGAEGGRVYMGGAGGTILSYQGGTFTAMQTPASDVSVFGIWGCSPRDLWAVGGGANGTSGGFAWRLDGGDTWVEAEGFPSEVADADAVWKVYGRGCDDVWMVGTQGLALHWNGEAFGAVERVAGGSLFTVHANADRFVAVGGFGEGILVENNGSGWVDASQTSDPMIGVCLSENGGIAAGWYGAVLSRAGGEWEAEETGVTVTGDKGFHSVWIDPDGGAWLAGGQVFSPPLGHGLMVHKD